MSSYLKGYLTVKQVIRTAKCNTCKSAIGQNVKCTLICPFTHFSSNYALITNEHLPLKFYPCPTKQKVQGLVGNVVIQLRGGGEVHNTGSKIYDFDANTTS